MKVISVQWRDDTYSSYLSSPGFGMECIAAIHSRAEGRNINSGRWSISLPTHVLEKKCTREEAKKLVEQALGVRES